MVTFFFLLFSLSFFLNNGSQLSVSVFTLAHIHQLIQLPSYQTNCKSTNISSPLCPHGAVCLQGLQFLHSSELKVHGNLRSSNCLVDNRWTCKLSGFGLRNLLRGEQPLDTQDDNTRYTSEYGGGGGGGGGGGVCYEGFWSQKPTERITPRRQSGWQHQIHQ